MNRSGLVILGFAVALIGYALVFSGLTDLKPERSPTGAAVSTIDSLIPGKVQAPNERGKVKVA